VATPGRPDEHRVIGTEEAMAQGIVEMLDKDNKIKTLTDLNDEEINALTLLDTLGERFKIKELANFVHNFSLYRIARERMGRREIGGMVTFAGSVQQERGRRSIRDLFAGLK
jgi:hypothetical protein